jgi:hypothetical protein
MHEYIRPVVVEVTPERQPNSPDDFIPQEYVAEILDLSANVIYVDFGKQEAA